MRTEKFGIIKRLGAGAFAETSLVEVLDQRLRRVWGEKVVIKIPHNKEKEEVLINEIIINNTLKNLQQKAESKNIVRYLGHTRFKDMYVMVMEYIEGGDLRGLLGPVGNQAPLRLNESLDIIEQVCEGLIEIHKYNVFHRDIKPENILFCKKDLSVKLTDFGIARFLSSTELASTTAGTIYYMAKEVIDGEGGSFYSDIYSLGVLMYEMLTGELPFMGEGLGKIVENICNQSPKPPMEINAQVNQILNKIILKAMEKEPDERYKTAEALLEAIRLCRQGKDEDDAQIEKGVALAQQLFGSGGSEKISEAEGNLKKLLEKYPQNPKIYLGLGEFYNRCMRFQDALRIFKAGTELSPDFALLYRDMAIALYSTGSKNKAIDILRKAIELGLEQALAESAQKLLEIWERQL